MFMYCRFTISGRVVGAVGGESCLVKDGGPSNVNVELLSHDGDLISSVVTSSGGSYLFKNIIPGIKGLCCYLLHTQPYTYSNNMALLVQENTNYMLHILI